MGDGAEMKVEVRGEGVTDKGMGDGSEVNVEVRGRVLQMGHTMGGRGGVLTCRFCRRTERCIRSADFL